MSGKSGKMGSVYCSGSRSFIPSQALQDKDRHETAIQALHANNDLETAIRAWFSIDEQDSYIYHATVSVKLSQVQQIINQGGANGLHAWYWTEKGAERHSLPLPPAADIDSYISIFLPTTSTTAALKSFVANAKRSSIRSAVASHLIANRFINPSHTLSAQLSSIPKTKAALPCNPYLDFWAWSCHALEWCGPLAIPSSSPPSSTTTSSTTSSSSSPPSPTTTTTTTTTIIMPPLKTHPLLAILMHHFGCAIPTHESLTTLKLLSDNRPIADLGSGSGYWSMMLRAYGVSTIPVDSAQSEWRVNWLDTDPGTVRADGAEWLSAQQDGGNTAGPGGPKPRPPKAGSSKKIGGGGKGKGATPQKGGKDLVLLIVYPILGPEGTGSFTRSLMGAYAGDTVAVVGTQNRNGYTGFKDMTMDEYMEREHGSDGWKKVVQIPLPSFAGKDEALFVFQRGDRLGSNLTP